MTEKTQTVMDMHGIELGAGMRVQIPTIYRDADQPKLENWVGNITHITDADADVNEYGRAYQVNPQVGVRFDSEDTDTFPTYSTAQTYGDDLSEFKCSELELCPK